MPLLIGRTSLLFSVRAYAQPAGAGPIRRPARRSYEGRRRRDQRARAAWVSPPARPAALSAGLQFFGRPRRPCLVVDAGLERLPCSAGIAGLMASALPFPALRGLRGAAARRRLRGQQPGRDVREIREIRAEQVTGSSGGEYRGARDECSEELVAASPQRRGAPVSSAVGSFWLWRTDRTSRGQRRTAGGSRAKRRFRWRLSSALSRAGP